MKSIASTVAAGVLAATLPAIAFAAHSPQHTAGAAPSEAVDGFARAEVKKIDKEAGKITLKHGPIQSLDMPGMTMVFRAKDTAALDKVKVGDTVLFKAERINGALIVTELRQGS